MAEAAHGIIGSPGVKKVVSEVVMSGHKLEKRTSLLPVECEQVFGKDGVWVWEHEPGLPTGCVPFPPQWLT